MTKHRIKFLIEKYKINIRKNVYYDDICLRTKLGGIRTGRSE